MIRSLLHRTIRHNHLVQCVIGNNRCPPQPIAVVSAHGGAGGTNSSSCSGRRSRPLSTTAQQQQHGDDNSKKKCQENEDHFKSKTWKHYDQHSEKQKQQQHPSLDSLTKHVELDFFGEPVTFLHDSTKDSSSSTGKHAQIQKVRSNSLAAMDGFLLCVVSKGKTCTYGGGEGGLEIQSAHSSAIAWTEALVNSMIWNYQKNDQENNNGDANDNIIPFAATLIAPMLAAVTVAPILAQTGIAYVKHLDTLLLQCKSRVPGLPPVQMMDMAYAAIQYKDSTEHFNDRECMHLQALYHLLHQQYPTALITYLKILRSCPGDALAMSLVMDLSLVLGDKQAALRYVVRVDK